jgi:hypothetical protein
MSVEWAKLQGEHLSILRNKDRRYSSQQLISGIVATLWKHWFHVCDIRDGDVHGGDEATKSNASVE